MNKKTREALKDRWDEDYLAQLNNVLWKKDWHNRRQVNINFLNSPFGELASKQDFRGLDLKCCMYQNLQNIDLSCSTVTAINRGILTNVNFDYATILSGIKSIVTNCSFEYANLTKTVFNKDDDPISNTSFYKANFCKVLGSALVFVNCNFNSANLKRVDLRNCHFENCTFIGAEFFMSTLINCTFVGEAPQIEQLTSSTIINMEINGKKLDTSNIKENKIQEMIEFTKDIIQRV